ncbi:hypothetical protein TcasGA2_TC035008, partial [Tribolium castaneum]
LSRHSPSNGWYLDVVKEPSTFMSTRAQSLRLWISVVHKGSVSGTMDMGNAKNSPKYCGVSQLGT